MASRKERSPRHTRTNTNLRHFARDEEMRMLTLACSGRHLPATMATEGLKGTVNDMHTSPRGDVTTRRILSRRCDPRWFLFLTNIRIWSVIQSMQAFSSLFYPKKENVNRLWTLWWKRPKPAAHHRGALGMTLQGLEPKQIPINDRIRRGTKYECE